MPEIILPDWVEPHKQRALQLLTPKSPEVETGVNLGYQQVVGDLIAEHEKRADWDASIGRSWIRFVLMVDIESTEMKRAIQEALIQFTRVAPRIGRDPRPESTRWPKGIIRPHEASAIIEKFGLVTGEQKGPLRVARELGFPGKNPGPRAEDLINNGFRRLGPILSTQNFLQEIPSTPRNTPLT